MLNQKTVELDLAMNAGHLIAENKIEIENSREFIGSEVPRLAEEFITRSDESKIDFSDKYLELIDEFARKQLIELYGIENSHEEPFAIIRWCKEDLTDVFKNNGIPHTEDNINIFVNSKSPRSLEERSVEEGWETLEILVSDMKEEFNFVYSDEDLAKEMIDIYWGEGTLKKEIADEWHEFLSGLMNLGIFEPVLKLLSVYFEDESHVDLSELVESVSSFLKGLNPTYYFKVEKEYNANLQRDMEIK